MAALAARQSALEATLAALLAERATLIQQTQPVTSIDTSALTSTPETPSNDDAIASEALTSAQVRIKHHIATLHRYNEVKDVGQGLLGLVAEGRGVRVKDVMEDFGLGVAD